MPTIIEVDFKSKEPAVLSWINLLTAVPEDEIFGADQIQQTKYPSIVVAIQKERKLREPSFGDSEETTNTRRYKYTPKGVTMDINFYSTDNSARTLSDLFFNSLQSTESVEFLSQNGLAVLSGKEAIRLDERTSKGWKRRRLVEIVLEYVNVTYEEFPWITEVQTERGTAHTETEQVDVITDHIILT